MSLVPDVAIFDAHMHVGQNDPDGFRAAGRQIVEALELCDGRGVIFPFHEPDGYHQANDQVIADVAASGGRLACFCRLDPRHENAPREAERALDAGAAGIKLHPRAENFSLAEPELVRVFEIANERKVPVIIHAGRGIPALGVHTVEHAEAFPDARIILAHCGISDLSWIWRDARRLPNLYFDTSWWSPADVIALCSLVPPGQVLFASDTPYGTPLAHSLFVVRCARHVGMSDDQVRGVMGGQLERLIARDEPLDLGPAIGQRERPADVLLMRVATFLTMAIGRIFSGDDGAETLQLARLACDVVDDDPHADVFAAIVSLLDIHDEIAAPSPRNPGSRGVHTLMTAICLAATPELGAPSPVAE
jgi:predicted TIM-barrel fold metal-dependent hydrolase